MSEQNDNDNVTKFDFQQMMKEIEAENVRPVLKNVKRDDISQLFKNKKSSSADDKSQ